MVNWDYVGKKDPKKGGQQSSSLFSPHRYRDVKARLAVSGPVSAHSVLVNDEGQAMTFGKLIGNNAYQTCFVIFCDK